MVHINICFFTDNNNFYDLIPINLFNNFCLTQIKEGLMISNSRKLEQKVSVNNFKMK